MDTNSNNPDKQVLDEEFPDLALINSDDDNLMSETYEEILDALDILYIKGNLSGRLRFHEAWPVMGGQILGEELLEFDQNGVTDFERRKVLEEEAEDRRLAMIEKISVIPENSVEKGTMQVDYIESTVKEFGRDLALEIYASKIVDRFIPPAPVVEEEQEETDVEAVADVSAEGGEIAQEAAVADPVPQAAKDDYEFSTDGLSVPQDNLSSVSSFSASEQQAEATEEQRAERPEQPAAAMIEGADPIDPAPVVSETEQPAISVNEEDPMDDVRPVEASPSISPPAPVEPPPPEPKVHAAPDATPPLPVDPFLDYEEDPLDAIQPISVGPSPSPAPELVPAAAPVSEAPVVSETPPLTNEADVPKAPEPVTPPPADNQFDIPEQAPALEIDHGHQKSEPEPHQPNQWETPAAASLEIEEPYERHAQPNQWENPAQLAPENRIEEPVSPVEPLSPTSPISPPDPVAPVEPPASAYDEPERPVAPPTPPKPADDGANEFQPNQWANPEPEAPTAPEEAPAETIQNDAMQGFQVSQKMTFVPSPKEGEGSAEEAPKSPVIPVIGGSPKTDDQDGDGE